MMNTGYLSHQSNFNQLYSRARMKVAAISGKVRSSPSDKQVAARSNYSGSPSKVFHKFKRLTRELVGSSSNFSTTLRYPQIRLKKSTKRIYNQNQANADLRSARLLSDSNKYNHKGPKRLET